MGGNMGKKYNDSFNRYIKAMKNEKPDRVPLRILAAEFVAKYAGYTVQEVTYDYNKAYKATALCAKDFKWDAANPNQIYLWGGIVDHFGQRYYKLPGRELSPEVGFQYIEPVDEDGAYMKEDEYDQLIDSPTEYLANVWIPRISSNLSDIGSPNTYRNNMAWLKGGISLMSYIESFGHAFELFQKAGCCFAVAGILKAPFDIIADKLRGFRQVSYDVYRRPDKVLAACEALTPYLYQNALYTADPDKKLPIGLWLHRGTLFSEAMYKKFFWPTLKEILIELYKQGHQTLWYGEGNWQKWLKYTAELPDGCIIYHVDKEDIFEAHKALGGKFCISGGIPNDLLAYGEAAEVKEYCKKVIQTVGKDGGYILDASAIMQSDARIENVKAMTEAVFEYGVY
jgi:methoxylated aromatic compound---corrinoid protein Co-methyltransferase